MLIFDDERQNKEMEENAKKFIEELEKALNDKKTESVDK